MKGLPHQRDLPSKHGQKTDQQPQVQALDHCDNFAAVHSDTLHRIYIETAPHPPVTVSNATSCTSAAQFCKLPSYSTLPRSPSRLALQ